LDAGLRRRESRHHEIERIARPFAVGKQPVEFGVGAFRWRLQCAIRSLEQSAEHLPAKFKLVERRKLDGLFRIEQRIRRARFRVIAVAENGCMPADRATGLPLKQQQPQLWPTFKRGADQFANPCAQWLDAARGVVEYDQDGLIPTPVHDVVLFTETVETFGCRKSSQPALLRDLARDRKRQRRFAPTPRADKNADGDGRIPVEPRLQFVFRAFAADEGNYVCAIGAEPRRFGIALNFQLRLVDIAR
jgi:hypothetical protein